MGAVGHQQADRTRLGDAARRMLEGDVLGRIRLPPVRERTLARPWREVREGPRPAEGIGAALDVVIERIAWLLLLQDVRWLRPRSLRAMKFSIIAVAAAVQVATVDLALVAG